MPRIILYGPAPTPFTRKVQGALALKKLPYELVEPQSPEDYRRWSPETGLLPVIEIDGDRTHDSARILDELDRRFPQVPLVARDPKTARSQRRLEHWVEAALSFYWMNYLRQLVEPDESAPPPRAGMREEFEQRLTDLANFLGGRPYFYADEPSRADLSVWSFLSGVEEALATALGGPPGSPRALEEHSARIASLVLRQDPRAQESSG